MAGTKVDSKSASKQPSAVPIPGARKQVVSEFRQNYTKTHRAMEISSATVFVLALIWHLKKIAENVLRITISYFPAHYFSAWLPPTLFLVSFIGVRTHGVLWSFPWWASI